MQFSPDLLLQSSLEQLQKQEIVSVIGTIIIKCKNDILNKLGGLSGWNGKDEGGQVVGLYLQQVEEVLVAKQLLP